MKLATGLGIASSGVMSGKRSSGGSSDDLTA